MRKIIKNEEGEGAECFRGQFKGKLSHNDFTIEGYMSKKFTLIYRPYTLYLITRGRTLRIRNCFMCY